MDDTGILGTSLSGIVQFTLSPEIARESLELQMIVSPTCVEDLYQEKKNGLLEDKRAR